MERLKSFDEEYTSMFAEIYKNCQNSGGEMVILSPSKEIEIALKKAASNNKVRFEYIDTLLTKYKIMS